jgi:hypothetical protein
MKALIVYSIAELPILSTLVIIFVTEFPLPYTDSYHRGLNWRLYNP